jgi:hypothetical protein
MVRCFRVFRVFLFLFCTASVAAQHHPAPGPVPAAALEQIKQIQELTRPLGSPAAADSAGFRPVFGWIPTMGTHYVSPARMLSGNRFDPKAPPQLMFSPIDGKETLVGAAFAYLANEGDTIRPASFEGRPPWHEHPDLAPPGLTLVMLHVWFVPSPDGPFAGHNPWLPFWALGLTPPDSTRFRDHDAARRVRLAALALGEVADSLGPFPRLAGRPGIREQLSARRLAIRALVPALDSAGRAGNWNRWERIAGELGTQWTAIRAIYLGAVQRADFRARIEKFLDEMEGMQ